MDLKEHKIEFSLSQMEFDTLRLAAAISGKNMEDYVVDKIKTDSFNDVKNMIKFVEK